MCLNIMVLHVQVIGMLIWQARKTYEIKCLLKGENPHKKCLCVCVSVCVCAGVCTDVCYVCT